MMTSQQILKSNNETGSFELNEIINLIDGDFSIQEAKEVLLELINHKIHFHQMKNFGWEERHGKPNEQSERRLTELRKDRERLLAVLDFAEQHNLQLQVQSHIDIKLVK